MSRFYEVHPGGSGHIKLRQNKDITQLIHSAPHPHSAAALRWLEQFQVKDEYTIASLPKIDYEDMDWDLGQLFRVGKIENYEDWVTTPVHRPLRIFDSNVLESMTHCPWYVVPAVWVPVSLWAASKCLKANDGSLVTLAATWVFGFFFWSLLEYMLHRFIFHLPVPKGSTKFRQQFQFLAHGLHHKVPFDPGRLVMPPVPCAILVSIIYSLCRVVIPLNYAWGVLSGGLIGYICYDMTHYYLHHGKPTPGSFMWRLRQHHNRHHFESHEHGFGITNFFWDDIWGTPMGPADQYNGIVRKSG